MAERRMLWKKICQSRKVNQLSPLATILYTWAISWTDRDGFIEVEADYLKYNVVPRRKDMPEEDIDSLVAEIVNLKLWDLYCLEDGRKVAFVKKHEDMQKGMDQRKERESEILNKINPEERIKPPYLPPGTAEVQEGYSSPPVERKGKEKKGKEIKENSKKIFESLKALASQIEGNYKNFNPWQAIQKAINDGCLIEDIQPALKYMVENQANKPWGCFENIIKAERHNRETIEREQAWTDKKMEETRDVVKLIKGIGGER